MCESLLCIGYSFRAGNIQYVPKKPVQRVEYYCMIMRRFAASITCMHCTRTRELLLKIMAVLAKVGMLYKLPSILVDPCLYYCCTAHQALAALRSLCTEGCVRTNVHGRTQCYVLIYMDHSYSTLRASSDRFFWHVLYMCTCT